MGSSLHVKCKWRVHPWREVVRAAGDYFFPIPESNDSGTARTRRASRPVAVSGRNGNWKKTKTIDATRQMLRRDGARAIQDIGEAIGGNIRRMFVETVSFRGDVTSDEKSCWVVNPILQRG
jgi:hypothetical protein